MSNNVSQGNIKDIMKARRKSNYAMHLQLGRSANAVMMSDEEQRELQEEDRGDLTIFGTRKKKTEGEKATGSKKLYDVLTLVDDIKKEDAASPSGKKEPKQEEPQPPSKNKEPKEDHQKKPHGPKTRSQVDPTLAASPDAYLGAIFAAGRKNAQSASSQRNSRGVWQQTDFPLCPHINMRLFWRSDDTSNKQDEWVFEVTPVFGNKDEHKECKGKIRGVQLNVGRLGEKVEKQMDHMRLKRPSVIHRVIRDMVSYLAAREAESERETEKKKLEKDDAAALKEKASIAAKKRKRAEEEEALQEKEEASKKTKGSKTQKKAAATTAKAGEPTTDKPKKGPARKSSKTTDQTKPTKTKLQSKDSSTDTKVTSKGVKKSVQQPAEEKTPTLTKEEKPEQKGDSETAQKQPPKSASKNSSKRKASELADDLPVDTQPPPSKKSKTDLDATPEDKTLLEDKEVEVADAGTSADPTQETSTVADATQSKKRKAPQDESDDEGSAKKKAKVSVE